LDRRSENSYIASYIEVIKASIEITVDSTWIYYLCTNKKIGIRRITDEVDPDDDYQFNLQIGYSIKQDSSYYIYSIQIGINLRKHKMFKIGQTIIDRIKNWEYVPNNVDANFDDGVIYGYLYIPTTMPADTSITFYLMTYWTNDYFSLPDDDTIDSNDDFVNVYSGNGKNCHYRLP
jgi:hypothetical protein